MLKPAVRNFLTCSCQVQELSAFHMSPSISGQPPSSLAIFVMGSVPRSSINARKERKLVVDQSGYN